MPVAAPVAIVVASATSAVAGSWPSGVTTVTTSTTTPRVLAGKLESGKPMSSLTWAANSAVACFPATENVNFEGNHVLYATSLPAASEMTITATPDDPSLDISLYAYTIGSTDFSHVVPNLPSATACEASYDGPHDHNPGKAETLKLVATTNPYNVVIGVAGVHGATKGSFKLKVELATKATVTSAVLTARQLTSVGGKATARGKLESGGVLDLAWAAQSSVACFPATENVNFNGNHVLYKVSLPVQSEMTIKAIPASSNVDISLYAYTQAAGKGTVPPGVSSVVSCEGGYDQKTDHNPGVAESVKLIAITNPYDVIIGVAGANGLKAGAFTIQTEIKAR